MNYDMIETTHNLDALIKAAQRHPTPEIRDKLIEKEIDVHGNHIGYGAALALWYKLIPESTKAA